MQSDEKLQRERQGCKTGSFDALCRVMKNYNGKDKVVCERTGSLNTLCRVMKRRQGCM